MEVRDIGMSAIQFRLVPPMKPVIEPRVLSNLAASIRHTAESGAVALACLPLERLPLEREPRWPVFRVSHCIEQPSCVRTLPIGDRVQNPYRSPWPNSL